MKKLFLVLLTLSIVSCSEQIDLKTINLDIHIPARDWIDKSFFHFLEDKQSESLFVTEPTTVGDINCVGIFLEYVNIGNTKSCTLQDEDQLVFQKEGGLAPFSAAGTTIQIPDVLVGEQIIANIIGFNVTNASDCPNFDSVEIDDFEPGEGDVSDGFLLASQAFTVALNSNININLDTSQAIIAANEIEDCFFADETPSTTSNEIYGDGSDGSFSFTNSINLSSGTMGNGQFYTSNDRVDNIASDTTFTLNESITNRFKQGDMVLFHVVGEGSPSDCGANSLDPGSYRFIKIAAVSPPNTIILEELLASSITSGNLVNNPNQGGPFCMIQAIRVPQFENITIDSSAAALTFDANTFNYDSANYGGGVMAIKINGTLSITGTNDISFDMSFKGFSGGVALSQGDSYSGQGQVVGASPNGSGGSGSLNGGSFNAGGGAASSRSSGGMPQADSPSQATFSLPINTDCNSSSTHCLFFGSGGGGGNAGGVGAGGGIIVIHANNIEFASSGNVSIKVQGEDPSASTVVGGGGGAGGDLWLQANNINTTGAGALNLYINGGNGEAVPDLANYRGGGGGAGGFALFDYCSGALPTLTPFLVGGTGGAGELAGPAAASPGDDGTIDLNPGTCP